jgi:hypothetical protein
MGNNNSRRNYSPLETTGRTEEERPVRVQEPARPAQPAQEEGYPSVVFQNQREQRIVGKIVKDFILSNRPPNVYIVTPELISEYLGVVGFTGASNATDFREYISLETICNVGNILLDFANVTMRDAQDHIFALYGIENIRDGHFNRSINDTIIEMPGLIDPADPERNFKTTFYILRVRLRNTITFIRMIIARCIRFLRHINAPLEEIIEATNKSRQFIMKYSKVYLSIVNSIRVIALQRLRENTNPAVVPAPRIETPVENPTEEIHVPSHLLPPGIRQRIV